MKQGKKPAKKHIGRPPENPDEPLEETLTIRVSRRLKKQIDMLRQKQPRVSYIREALERDTAQQLAHAGGGGK